ncbi:hypothetical protein KUCAC02_022918, partial [Chaenocephalus aceratus]
PVVAEPPCKRHPHIGPVSLELGPYQRAFWPSKPNSSRLLHQSRRPCERTAHPPATPSSVPSVLISRIYCALVRGSQPVTHALWVDPARKHETCSDSPGRKLELALLCDSRHDLQPNPLQIAGLEAPRGK